MQSISIKFQAYIPNTLGRPLASYFENSYRLDRLENKREFLRKLRAKDGHGYTWLPEPGNLLTKNFYSTDDAAFHNSHSEHSVRLGFHAEIEPHKIGNLSLVDPIFKHHHHENWTGHNHQHSGLSHQVKAYIKRYPFYDDRPSNRDVYIGYCDDEVSTLRSYEAPINASINNSLTGLFYFPAGARKENNTSMISVKATAGYPFTEPLSPNIDFGMDIKLVKNVAGSSVDISVSGWHNHFPAYELLINNKVSFNYDPSIYGYTGPGLINLNRSKNFNASEYLPVTRWAEPEMAPRFGGGAGGSW